MTDQIEWRSAGGFRGIGSASGNVVVQLNPGEMGRPMYYGWHYLRMNKYSAPSYAVAFSHLEPGRTFGTWEFAGVGWYTVRDRNGGRTATGVAPFWLLTAVTAALPMVWTTRRLRARRAWTAGCCPSCGYDLRASPERCPECGTIASANSRVDPSARGEI